ncbi:MAG: 3-hydroxybutyryl-CoA dehydrogenase [Acidobacteria bacterium RIFCSPLOWO2_02_FULL_61_28]|nr:MAG: 3-hydroxybutyryl-CoA dehydrogenase [Acidobacteria bacterium RIFCSPLOWO2_02_FULL_61_28]
MTVQNVAVIGSGLMGRGIAQVAALGGFRTTIVDVSESILQTALTNIRSEMEKGVSLGKMTAEQKEQALSRLLLETNLEKAARDADLVIEAVPEDMKLKIETFVRLDNSAPAGALLASNTSSLSITEMAAVTKRPRQFLGMHFFNPVHKMKLLEIVRGLETAPETVKVAEEVGRQMGKETVVIKESPGFITSRINAMIGNEAFYMLQEEIATAADIDKAVKLGLNHPMGPFEMADLVGLDTRLHVLEYLHQTLGEKFRPAPLMVQYVKAGRLGRKVGRGVYDYPPPEKKA